MIKGSTIYDKRAEALQGIYTIETLTKRLKIGRTKAIYIIHKLRERGFVKTWYGNNKRRVYTISLRNRRRGISYTEKINEASANPAIMIAPSNDHYVYNQELSYEEALIYAIKQKRVRYIIASLALFKKIRKWSLLYALAKKENMLPEIGALYEIARKTIRKIRKMPKRFLHLARKRKTKKMSYIIPQFTSNDFKEIEKKWNIYIPLNRADLEEYRK